MISFARGPEPAEPLLRNLPVGTYLENSAEVPAAQAQAIGNKLGGEIIRLTNSAIKVQGAKVKINVITAADESQAEAIEKSLLKIKPFPFCLRKGALVAEYVGKELDTDTATKTSYELGLLPKPRSVRYRVTAELATIDTGDYMACNPLLNVFRVWRGGDNADASAQIQELAKRLKFGHTLVLRNLGCEAATHEFQPPQKAAVPTGAAVSYTFDELPVRVGIPFVTAKLDLTVDNTGIRESRTAPGAALTAATPFWPAKDSKIRALAQKITRGKTTNPAKAQAILEWLAPGLNLKTDGPTGSRWGTMKVLEQKFGHCWDFSDVFVTLARAVGVPSRQVAGWLFGTSGHVWAEYWSEGQGWQQVDPTGGGKLQCGIYHIPYFTTENGEMPIVYGSWPKIEVLNKD